MSKSSNSPDQRPYVFILSWERPLFLWSTLDSLYRNTKLPVRFVLIDNNSKDPLVKEVIKGFDRRSMFEDVIFCRRNDPKRMEKIFAEYKDRLGPFFFFVENDVTVPSHLCWATTYKEIYDTYPDTGMIGSFCDKSDFVDPGVIRAAEPKLAEDKVVFYSQSNSPERKVEPGPGEEIWSNELWPNPPGRLILLSTQGVDVAGFHPDKKLSEQLRRHGYGSKISTAFTHRHLSLLNWYFTSERNYSLKRAGFFEGMTKLRMKDRVWGWIRLVRWRLIQIKHSLFGVPDDRK